MYRIVHLTLGAGILVFSLFLITACKKETVTEVAQANANAPATTSSPDATQATQLANPNASPLPGASPVPPGAVPSPLPTGAIVPGASPLPGATPDPAPNMKHLNNGKVLMVTGSQGAKDFVEPPPTPTPTPAPTPPVEMVNGKIKQQWEAPAEYASLKSPLKATPDVIKRGQYLYKNRCEICHGAEGKGNGFYNKPEYKQATNLTSQVVQANTDGELFYKVSMNRDRHPSSRMLYSEEERWMIVAFLRTLK
jgi:mono/diheme cytochrome c family protein